MMFTYPNINVDLPFLLFSKGFPRNHFLKSFNNMLQGDLFVYFYIIIIIIIIIVIIIIIIIIIIYISIILKYILE